MTSRIASAPVISITRRSMPIPSPPVGRQPVLERVDVVLVDRLGLLVAAGLGSFASASKRCAWSTGSLSSQ